MVVVVKDVIRNASIAPDLDSTPMVRKTKINSMYNLLIIYIILIQYNTI